ncbi:MAG: branched-chain amino acid aminotransferase, partial [Candidatus Thiodiazotropha endolucinida]|nr:branched-chain amino acid aminotransferase [Candidatus Thiodiazotropha endolucinida]
SVTESPLTSYDLYNADECFLTGTGAELIPVRKIDGRKVNSCPGPVFKELEGCYRYEIAVKDDC